MTPAQVAYWGDIFAKTVRTEECKKFTDSAGWKAGYKYSQETTGYLRKDYAEARGILTKLGLAK